MSSVIAALPGAARSLCLSRRGGEVCTREREHRGLHHRRGTNLLWSERDADAAHCSGSGREARPAPALDNGYPGGRALCPVCWGFEPLDEQMLLVDHDSWRGDATRDEADRRREWFNTYGW